MYSCVSDGMIVTEFKRSLKNSFHLPRMSPHFCVNSVLDIDGSSNIWIFAAETSDGLPEHFVVCQSLIFSICPNFSHDCIFGLFHSEHFGFLRLSVSRIQRWFGFVLKTCLTVYFLCANSISTNGWRLCHYLSHGIVSGHIRGVTRRGKGAQFPGRQVTMGRQITTGGAEWLREAPKSPNNVISTCLHTVAYICFRNTSVSNMGALNLLLAPGAI